MEMQIQPDMVAQPGTQINTEVALIQEVSWPLYRARNWLKFLGILYIILGGLYIVLALVGLFLNTTLTEYRELYSNMALTIGLAVAIGFSVILIWLGVILFKAGIAVNTARVYGQKIALMDALGNLKTFFTIMGIMVVISLGIALIYICSALIFLGAISQNL